MCAQAKFLSVTFNPVLNHFAKLVIQSRKQFYFPEHIMGNYKAILF